MRLYCIGRVTKFTEIIFSPTEDDGCFEPKDSLMQEAILRQHLSSRFNEIDGDAHLKQVLDRLQGENNQLKKLVVRLSETIIRNVAAKR
jgi:hypothetical protein